MIEEGAFGKLPLEIYLSGRAQKWVCDIYFYMEANKNLWIAV